MVPLQNVSIHDPLGFKDGTLFKGAGRDFFVAKMSESYTRSMCYTRYIPRSSKGCVSWMIRGAEKHHSLGFKQHPLEDAGIFV